MPGIVHSVKALLFSIFFLLFTFAPPIEERVLGQTPDKPSESAIYTESGADTCLLCHGGEDTVYPVPSLFKTPHAERDDKRTPFAKRQCEGCHGPGAAHAGEIEGGANPPRMLGFGPDAETPVALQNKTCLHCHERKLNFGWHGGVHQSNDLSCASCHTIHAEHDPVLNSKAQPKVCFKCHLRQRAESLKPSAHPIRFGLMTCTTCHAPHGADTEYQLIRPTINETCYDCHAEKRGPFLWEHAPVSEDCTLCHRPHGSNHPALLNKRPPFLCQQCHARAGHPSLPNRPGGLPPAGASAFLLGKSCLNCHAQVHGSNHPSGARLSR
ncbi:MAG: DmsE family decaheme c-type cytochrome [Nitrospiria bacterium]